MKLNPNDLDKIASLTLDHYDQRAEEFWQGTRDHDVKQNIAALLQWIETKPPFTILDFGCGPGRDLKVFSELGHVAVGLEGAAHFAVMARTYSGCEVWQQDFLKLDLPDNYFDGVYANASLLRAHINPQAAPDHASCEILARVYQRSEHRKYRQQRAERLCADGYADVPVAGAS